MLYGGLIFSVLGPVWAYFNFVTVWWRPLTVTKTIVGPEDFILAFSCIGIALSVYKFVFRKEMKRDFKTSRVVIREAFARLPWFFIACFVPILILRCVFVAQPIVSIFCGQFLAGLYVIVRRPDLTPAMIWTAVLMIAVTYPVFILGQYVFPGVVQQFWNFKNLTGYVFWGYPLEDMIFFALWGFQCGGILEFMFDCRLVDHGRIML
jgi:hypothetical protein